MARDFSRAFYKSKQWEDARAAYIRSVHGLCERCFAHGKLVPGEIVHHKVHLSPENINDPAITLGFDNLEYVCRQCHADEHPEIYGRGEEKAPPRYGFDEFGNLVNTEGLNAWMTSE